MTTIIRFSTTRRSAVSYLLLLIATAIALDASAQTVPASADGEALFNARCKSCHDPAVERAPGRAELAVRPRADIERAMSSGVMAPMSQGMSPAQMQAVSAFLTTAPAGGGRAAIPPIGVDRMCATHPPIAERNGDWNSIGVSSNMDRFQRNPELKPADVPRLKLKWAFSMTGGGQPTVVGDWLFMANRGKFYALDAKTGCVHWVINDASSRNTPMIVRSSISPSGWATFLGIAGRTVRAYDVQNGKEIWRSAELEKHQSAGITGTPVIHGDRIFVPLSSGEEGAAMQATYACCTFRGSLVALDLKTGAKLWQTFTVTEPMQKTRLNETGKQMLGPAGAAIWSAPTIDAKRGLVYAVTGDSYTEVDTIGADALMAFDMKTGKVRWQNQVTKGDNYVMSCDPTRYNTNCPNPAGPDFDFGASPILFNGSNGKQILVAGQKSGLVYGFDPDTGKVLWTTRVGSGSPLGGVEWGIGADDKNVYVPNADTVQLIDNARKEANEPQRMPNSDPARPGLTALNPMTGKILWHTPAPIAPCKYAGDRSRDYAKGACIRAQSAAPAVIPGVIFSGTLDGWFRAYNSATGKIIWEYSTTAQTYDTVNEVKGQPGGGIDGMGPTVAHGMVYTMSGFNGASRTGGNGNNVLLAFSVDGK